MKDTSERAGQDFAGQAFSLEHHIHAPRPVVWRFLTDPKLVPLWMSDSPEFSIDSDWHLGSPITITAVINGATHINEGTITLFKPQRALGYTYVNSVSAEAYQQLKKDAVEFLLADVPGGTLLSFRCDTAYTEVEAKHLRLYWTATLTILKQQVEGGQVM